MAKVEKINVNEMVKHLVSLIWVQAPRTISTYIEKVGGKREHSLLVETIKFNNGIIVEMIYDEIVRVTYNGREYDEPLPEVTAADRWFAGFCNL